MNLDLALDRIRDLIQEDIGDRGLCSDPRDNLITAWPRDLHEACRSLAGMTQPAVAVVTGFHILHAQPPSAETDGPPGAVFLARTLAARGMKVVLATDALCLRALEVGLAACGLRKVVPVVCLPPLETTGTMSVTDYWEHVVARTGPLTHLVALERVGPSHTPESLQEQPGTTQADIDCFLAEVPAEHHDRCHTMRGLDITAKTSPAYRLFEAAARQDQRVTTIGIGDGGNEIGMGKIPWSTIRRNIPQGGLIACRVPVDHLIVAGVSNWGAYALSAGVVLFRDGCLPADFFDGDQERQLLNIMVDQGPLVDGITARQTATVDGLSWEQYVRPLHALAALRA